MRSNILLASRLVRSVALLTMVLLSPLASSSAWAAKPSGLPLAAQAQEVRLARLRAHILASAWEPALLGAGPPAQLRALVASDERTPDRTGSSLLQLAIAAGTEPGSSQAQRQLDLVRSLLRAGAAPNAYRPATRAPLSIAVQRGSLPLVQLLLAHGADPGAAPAVNGLPAASAWQQAEAARRSDLLLLMQPYRIAAAPVSPGIAQQIETAAELSPFQRSLQALSPAASTEALRQAWLRLAINQENTAAIEALAAWGLDLNSPLAELADFAEDPPTTLSALQLAVLTERGMPVLSALLERGARPDLQIPGGLPDTALGLALTRHDAQAAALLLRHGADPNARASGAMPLLAQAVGQLPPGARPDHAEHRLVAQLLQTGAQVNAVDSLGLSALHLAALGDDASAVRLLLAHGADRQLRSVNGHTPCDLARAQHARQAAKALACPSPRQQRLSESAAPASIKPTSR